jgi:2,4-dienoyl-CoA reductase (NADPH2)
MNNFQKLLEPGFIGKVKIRNRMIKTGAGTSFVEKGGYIGETIKNYYGSLARGGVGLIIVESCGIDYPLGIHHLPVQLHLEDDKYIPGYRELTDVIHQYQCPAFLQLFHSGPWHPSHVTGQIGIAASELSLEDAEKMGIDKIRGISVSEIEGLVDKFAKAAVRAQEAGFDGIEINANSTHLINTFMSPLWNKRDDQFGPQSLDNRARFLVKVIQEVRERTGSNFAVSVLLTGAEYGLAGGITSDDSAEFARLVQETGADAVQVRGFGYANVAIMHPGPERILLPEPPKDLVEEMDWSYNGAGAWVPLAAKIKRNVTIPVIAVGRLDPVLGEKVLEDGKADFIGLHRRLIADPELPNKVAAGKLDDIAPCTACYYCWHERINDRHIKCRINSAVGKEREYSISPATKKKKVLVVGGGPAGMEAARVAALKGHDVYLYEKSSRLGGLLSVAALVKGFHVEDLTLVINYLSRQIRKAGVKVKLGKEVNRELVDEIKPDVLILATGGSTPMSGILGINHKNVIQSSSLHSQLKFFLRFISVKTLRNLTKIWIPVSKNLIIIGGGIHGLQLAEFLVSRGRKITIVETSAELGEGIVPSDTKRRSISWLREKGVNFLTEVNIESIADEGLKIVTSTGENKTLYADKIILAFPLQPDKIILDELGQCVPEVYSVGDCREPRLTSEAIADGAAIAHKI